MNIWFRHYFICHSVHTFVLVYVPECGLYEAEVAVLRHLALALSNSSANLSALFISGLTLWVKDSGVRWGAVD